jgi:hypothetical protein
VKTAGLIRLTNIFWEPSIGNQGEGGSIAGEMHCRRVSNCIDETSHVNSGG